MHKVVFSIFENDRYMDLGIYQAGEEECVPGHMFGPSTRNHYLFHYVHSGKGKLISPDSTGTNVTREISAGQGFLIYPGQITTYMADYEDPWVYSWIEFDGLKVLPTLELSELSVDHPVWKSHNQEAHDAMKDYLFRIVHHSREESLEIIGLLYLFLSSLVKASRKSKPAAVTTLADFYVKEAISYFEQHYSEDISIEDTAAALGISRNYLSKIFQRIIGTSPREFLMRYRMNQAARLLCVTNAKIADISRRVGYENQLHFSRAFKTFFDVSPREYRNLHKLSPADSVQGTENQSLT